MTPKTWNEATISTVRSFVSCSERIETMIRDKAPFEIVRNEIEEAERRLNVLKAIAYAGSTVS